MNPTLRGIIFEDGDLNRVFNNAEFTKSVEFTAPQRQITAIGVKYIISLTTEMQQELVALFPKNRDMRKQVVSSQDFKSLNKWNRQLNAQLNNSLDGYSTRIAIAYENHVYRLLHLSGTVYVLWADCINRINASNQANVSKRNCPVVVNMDGEARVKAIYVLNPNDTQTMQISEGNPRLLLPAEPIWVCETRPPPTTIRNIRTIAKREALAMVAEQSVPASAWLHYQNAPFASSDLEIEQETNWTDSPREIFELRMIKDTEKNNNNNTDSDSIELEPNPWDSD